MMVVRSVSTVLATCWMCAGCLGPLVSDEVAAAHLPAGSAVPQVADDPPLLARIDANDGVDREVGYSLAFAAGGQVTLWSFGPATPQALPMYIVIDRDGVPVPDHPPIIDAVPGDPGYHPFCAVFTVKATNAYSGERIVSLDALRTARRGDSPLLLAPESAGTVRACPVVHPDVTMTQPSGAPRPPGTAYYQGTEVPMYLFAERPLPEGSLDVPTMAHCHLRREGGEPLSEPVRRVDMTGDGDTDDSNDVLLFAPDEAGFSEAMRGVDVVVAADYASIDTSGDDGVADFMAGADLFAITADGALDPVVGHVVAWEPALGVVLTVAERVTP